MFKFKDFHHTSGILLTEASEESVKLHLSHLEDLAIEEGKAGFAKFEEQVENFLNYITGLSSNTKINAKIDGAPAIFFGADPRPEWNEHFFVATKGAFNVGQPKINHTNSEIDQNYSGILAQKLKDCLRELGNTYDNSGLIYQGDLLFSNKQEKKLWTDQNGQTFIVFKPNTIMYAVPYNSKSELFHRINNANVGIILHDSFKGVPTGNGKAISTRPAGKNFARIKELGKQHNVFIEDSTYSTVNITLDTATKMKIQELLSQSKEYMSEIPDSFDNEWKNSKLLELLKQYLNYQVRQDGGIFKKSLKNEDFNDDIFKRDFMSWVGDRFVKEMNLKKTERGKINVLSRRDLLFDWMNENTANFSNLLRATYLMLKVKNLFLVLLDSVEQKIGRSFYQTPEGSFKPAKGEGFVLFVGNNQVKLVDRISFSAENFKQNG